MPSEVFANLITATFYVFFACQRVPIPDGDLFDPFGQYPQDVFKLREPDSDLTDNFECLTIPFVREDHLEGFGRLGHWLHRTCFNGLSGPFIPVPIALSIYYCIGVWIIG